MKRHTDSDKQSWVEGNFIHRTADAAVPEAVRLPGLYGLPFRGQIFIDRYGAPCCFDLMHFGAAGQNAGAQERCHQVRSHRAKPHHFYLAGLPLGKYVATSSSIFAAMAAAVFASYFSHCEQCSRSVQ